MQKTTVPPHPLLIFLIGVILFLLANSPILIAKECFTLLGYRVLFPSVVMILIAQWGIGEKCADFWKDQKISLFIRIFAGGFISLSIGLASHNIKDVCQNYQRELSFLRQKLDSLDFKNTKKLVVITVPDGETLIERQIPFEFSYMITLPSFIDPLIEEAAQKKQTAFITPSVDDGGIVFFDQYTGVINLNDEIINPSAYKKYRFYLLPEGPRQPMMIGAVYMKMGI